jgi:hypothetical protein
LLQNIDKHLFVGVDLERAAFCVRPFGEGDGGHGTLLRVAYSIKSYRRSVSITQYAMRTTVNL